MYFEDGYVLIQGWPQSFPLGLKSCFSCSSRMTQDHVSSKWDSSVTKPTKKLISCSLTKMYFASGYAAYNSSAYIIGGVSSTDV